MSVALTKRIVTTRDAATLQAWLHLPEGLPDDAPTVVLAHGWTLGHQSWQRVIDALGDDVRIIAWDQRGHQGSSFAGGARHPGQESIKQLGQDLREVIDQVTPLHSPLILAGHSMGGMTVMAWAGIAPQEDLDRLRGIVLVSTASGELRGSGLPGERQLIKLASRLPVGVRLGPLVRDSRQRDMLFGESPRAEDVALATELSAALPIASYGAFYGALMSHDEIAALQRLGNTPVEIIVGDRDKLTPPKLSNRLAEEMPHATLHVVPGRGHMILLEDAELVADRIRHYLDEPSAAN